MSAVSAPRYEPFGWQHWPEHFFMSYQFRRALGETQEGGGAVSEVFLAASRMKPGDAESWHAEWLRIAEHNDERAERAGRGGAHSYGNELLAARRGLLPVGGILAAA